MNSRDFRDLFLLIILFPAFLVISFVAFLWHVFPPKPKVRQ